ncbi:hypothetical protein SHKM778_11560 [Streptomyces sp. KM77-8]|uniref:Uncharacterized protein n=1 Tax=Streptomyces haneummycinicus TaxID=3074435 RepID=A0AAT9HBM2_9ACTN
MRCSPLVRPPLPHRPGARRPHTNLAPAGPAGAAARIGKGFSEDPGTRVAVSDRRYGVIAVDGDHSAAGVAKNFQGRRRSNASLSAFLRAS